MKTFMSLIVFCLGINFCYGQDKTPVLSEMGSLRQESAQDNPATLNEKDTVVVVQDLAKKNRAKKTRKKAALTEAKKAEVEDEQED